MGYGTLIPALFFVVVTAILAFASLWMAQRARRMDDAARAKRALERRRAEEVPPGPNEVALFLRFERAGEATVRDVISHLDPSGEVPAGALLGVMEPLVDSLRLATHGETIAGHSSEVVPIEGVQSMSFEEGGVIARLDIETDAPLPILDDPTARTSLSGWLTALARLDPKRILSVKLEEVFPSSAPSALVLRPLHH